MAYIFGSIWDRFNRNALNDLSKSVEQQGKSIQDLVAEGQLTPTQYATLIQAVNGLISKGEVTFDDIDINKGKLLPKHLSEEVLKMLTGDTPVNAVPADGSITNIKVADKAVTPEKTSFFKNTRNLFDGEYMDWTVEADPSNPSRFFLRDKGIGYLGKTGVIPLGPGETYTIKIHEGISDRLRVGLSAQPYPPVFNGKQMDLDRVDNYNGNSLSVYTFTNDINALYAYIYVSSDSQEPLMQVEKGISPTDYIAPFLMPLESVEEKPSNIVVEDPITGYPARPKLQSVTWVGASEPKDAEVYDEWRDTGGFAYWADLDKYPIGSASSIFKPHWNTLSTNEIKYSDELGENYLDFLPLPAGFTSLSWTELNEDSYKLDAEAFLTGQLTHHNIPGGQLGVVFRGMEDSKNGYVVSTRPSEPDGTQGPDNTRLVVIKIVNGVHRELDFVNTGIDFLQPFHLVARIDGDRIRAKAWYRGHAEPKEWQIDTIDSEPTFTDGFVGLYSYMANSVYVYDFGVGTGGMRAPRKKLN